MMKGARIGRCVALLPIVLLAAICAPIFTPLAAPGVVRDALQAGGWWSDGWTRPAVRAALLALVGTPAVVLGTFFVAAFTSRRISSSLFTILLPISLVGSTAIAFVLKLGLSSNWLNALIAMRSPMIMWPLVVIFDVLPYVPLFGFLFSERLQSIPHERITVMKIVGATRGERLRDVDWPHCRNLAALLALYTAAEALREFAKTTIIFRASPGTSLELLAARLERYYFVWSNVNLGYAEHLTLGISCLLLIPIAAVATLAVGITLRAADSAAAAAAHLQDRHMSYGVPFLPMIFAIAAVVPLLGAGRFASTAVTLPWEALLRSISMATIAAGLLVFGSLVFAIASRLAWPNRTRRFDRASLPVFLALFALRFLPPLAVVLCTYHWLYFFSVSGGRTAVLAWTIAEVTLAFPLIAAFALSVHFSVPEAELLFSRMAGASAAEMSRDSFLFRFGLEYGLVGLFAFTVVLTEDAVNAAMSFDIPSVAQELLLRIAGRSGSFAEALAMIGLLAIPVILLVVGWTAIAARRYATHHI